MSTFGLGEDMKYSRVCIPTVTGAADAVNCNFSPGGLF